MIVLGIESSCDDCSLSLVEDGKRVLSLVTSSQLENHKPFGGVVPEIASRLHAQTIDLVFHKALQESGLAVDAIDLIAVTNRPGLVGSLTVGVAFAKGLALGLEKPLVGVDHIQAHLYAPFLDPSAPPLSYPFLSLLVSGGHTLIAKQTDFDEIEVLGTTLDDACGEAFDKVAKFYHLGFPGGPIIDELAKTGDATAYSFPIAKTKKDNAGSFDVSFSGLKTAVIHQSEKFLKTGKEPSLANLVASFQKTAFDTLLDRLEKALAVTGLKTVVIGGGVGANSFLRSSLQELSRKTGIEYRLSPLPYCTDNGAMIAGLGYQKFLKKGRDNLDLEVYSRVKPYKRFLK